MMALVPSCPTTLSAFRGTPRCSPHREGFCRAWGSPSGSAGWELPRVFARAPPRPVSHALVYFPFWTQLFNM